MFLPKSLLEAYALAKIQEITMDAIKEQSKLTNHTPYIPPISKASSYHHSSTTYPLKPTYNLRLLPTPKLTCVTNAINSPTNNKTSTNKNVDEKRVKGIYFWCDEKYTGKHKCKRKQAFMLQLNDLNEDASNELEEP